MPAKSHKSDYLILAVLGIISAVVIFALITWGWIREDETGRPPVRTTHSTNVEGAMVCYVLFDRLGVSVQRLEYPLLSEHLEQTDILFIINPLFSIQKNEAEELTQWVHGGGMLVCTDDVAETLLFFPETNTWRYSRCRAAFTSEGDPTAIPPDCSNLPLARDVRNLRLGSPFTLDMYDTAAKQNSGPIEPLLSDAEGCRLATRTVGAGRVVVLTDSSFLANDWIGKADNAILAANLAAYSISTARGNRVTFDEYHFGYGSRQTRWTAMGDALFGTSAGWGVLLATMAGLLFLFQKGRRFGTRRAPQRVRRRSKMEYIHSVGATYRAAGANMLTLRLIFTSMRSKSAETVGLPDSSPTGEIAKRLAMRTGGAPERYERVFQRCEEALAGQRLSGKRFAALLNELSTIESEIIYGHSTGK